jgi:hypothetical protein
VLRQVNEARWLRLAGEFGEFFEVGDEALHFEVAGLVVGGAEDGGGVNGGHEVRGDGGVEEFAAVLRDAEVAAEEGLCGGGTEAHDDLGLEESDFGVEPNAAGGNLERVGFFVDAALAAKLPFEMLDGVGDVGLAAVDAGFFQGSVEELSGRPDEGAALLVFLVAGLLAEEEDFRMGGTFAEDGLGGVFPKVAGFAVFGALAEFVDGAGEGNE